MFFNVLVVFLIIGCNQVSKKMPKVKEKPTDTSTKLNNASRNKNNLSQDEAGIVKIRDDHFNSKIDLYNADGSIWKSFSFDDEFNDPLLNPFAIKAENNLLVFTKTRTTDQFYEVVVNEKNKTRKYIKLTDENFVFETWEQHILKVFSVDFDNKKNPIRKAPDDSSTTVPMETGEDIFYQPISIKKNWLHVGTGSGSDGWIKWKSDDGKLIISIYYDA